MSREELSCSLLEDLVSEVEIKGGAGKLEEVDCGGMYSSRWYG